MRIYLDNCCYNRPFDDQSHLRIVLETQAKLFVQSLVMENKVKLIWSYVSALENQKNPYENRQLAIADFSKYAEQTILENDIILNNARRITAEGLSPADALHVACAIEAGADFFITTDDEILGHKTDKVRIVDPVQFVKVWEGEKNE
jgi:predicted nucleic acid-binding protein